jgi:hypothetical protein
VKIKIKNMITKIKEFNEALNSGKIKKINENFFEEDELSDDFSEGQEEEEVGADVDNFSDDTDETNVASSTTITLDELKDKLLTKFNNTDEDINGDGGIDNVDSPIMLSDEQLQIVFDVLVELGVGTSASEETTAGEGVEETETEEDIEDVEGTEEEIEEAFGFAKKMAGEDEKSIEERKNILISKLEKVVGKGFLLVNGETKKSVEINNAAEAIEAIAGDNNYNGMIIPKPVSLQGKTAFVYKPGRKGIEKLASVRGASGGLGI